MAFKNFEQVQRVKVIETGELVGAGSLQTASHMEAGYLRAVLYINGALAGTERLRAKLFHDQAMTKLYATSSWSALSGIPSPGSYWIGWLTFTFGRQHLSKSQAYWVGIEPTGYIRNGSAFYLGLCQDWAIRQNSVPSALAMELYGYRWLG